MKVKYNKKSNILNFNSYGQLHFQNGSLSSHKQNGVLDTDVIAGLMTYIAEMNKQHQSRYNILALGNLQSAFVFLRLRRLAQHAQNRKNAKNGRQKETKK